MVVDYSIDGRPIGIEITAPTKLSLDDFNGVMQDLGLPEATGDRTGATCTRRSSSGEPAAAAGRPFGPAADRPHR